MKLDTLADQHCSIYTLPAQVVRVVDNDRTRKIMRSRMHPLQLSGFADWHITSPAAGAGLQSSIQPLVNAKTQPAMAPTKSGKGVFLLLHPFTNQLDYDASSLQLILQCCHGCYLGLYY